MIKNKRGWKLDSKFHRFALVTIPVTLTET
jgi:hypothetical protein